MVTVAEATRDNFKDLVAQGLVLVDVWGPQCAPCVALEPHVRRIAEARPDLKVVKLEAPKARRLCMELKLMGLPVFLLFRDGREIGRLSGPEVTAERLKAWIDETIKSKEVS